MKAIKTRLLILTLATLLGASFTVHAMTASDAAQAAERTTGGKVLQVKQQKSGDYQVRVLLPNGQVKNILINNSEDSSRDSDRDNRSSQKPGYR